MGLIASPLYSQCCCPHPRRNCLPPSHSLGGQTSEIPRHPLFGKTWLPRVSTIVQCPKHNFSLRFLGKNDKAEVP